MNYSDVKQLEWVSGVAIDECAAEMDRAKCITIEVKFDAYALHVEMWFNDTGRWGERAWFSHKVSYELEPSEIESHVEIDAINTLKRIILSTFEKIAYTAA